MIATALSPAAGGFIPPLLWTVTDFHAICETGRFAGRRPVLLRGQILEQGPMNPAHAIALELLLEVFRATALPGFRLRVQSPLVVGTDSDPLPDLALVPGTVRDATPGHPTTAALVVEVSDTSLATDTTTKAELYATAAVPDYWVVDLVNRRLVVYRDPAPLAAGLNATAYRVESAFGPEDRVSPLAIPALSIRVADLLP